MTKQIQISSNLIKLTSRLPAKNETTIALAVLFVPLLFYAVNPILIKFCEYEINPYTLIFNRFWIGLSVLVCWNGALRLKQNSSYNSIPIKKFFPQDRKYLLLLLLSGLFSAGQQLLYAWSLTEASAANAEVLHSMTPLFITLIGWIFLSQQFERRYLIGIAIAIFGSCALAANDFSITIDKLQGDGLALLSALLWSGLLMILEKLQTKLNINVIITWNCLVGSVFLLPILLVSGNEIFPYSWYIWLIVAILGIMTMLNKICITYSFKHLPSGLVATILLLHPVVTALLAWGIFSETLNLLNCLAFLAILLGVYLATSSKVKV